jgi:hypothetical protein
MNYIRDEYLRKADGNVLAAAVSLARDLMRGDKASFKAGYTAENAAIAAAEVFGVERKAVLEVL